MITTDYGKRAYLKLQEIENKIKQKEIEKSKIMEEFTKTIDGKTIISLQKELKSIEDEITDLELEWFRLQDN